MLAVIGVVYYKEFNRITLPTTKGRQCMTTKSFLKSKTLWTLIIGLVVFYLNSAFDLDIPEALIVSLMSVLAMLFRWKAVTQLTK